MFIKINSEFHVINDSYIVCMDLTHTKDKYDIIAKMINGTTLLLMSFNEDKKIEAENNFRRMVQEGNLHHTVTYKGPELGTKIAEN